MKLPSNLKLPASFSERDIVARAEQSMARHRNLPESEAIDEAVREAWELDREGKENQQMYEWQVSQPA